MKGMRDGGKCEDSTKRGQGVHSTREAKIIILIIFNNNTIPSVGAYGRNPSEVTH